MDDSRNVVRAGRRPMVDTRALGAAEFDRAWSALADECRKARNDARYARSAEIEAERARERGSEPAAVQLERSAAADRKAACRRLAAIAYRMRAALLWAAYDLIPGHDDPYAAVADDAEDVLWRAMADASGEELRTDVV